MIIVHVRYIWRPQATLESPYLLRSKGDQQAARQFLDLSFPAPPCEAFPFGELTQVSGQPAESVISSAFEFDQQPEVASDHCWENPLFQISLYYLSFRFLTFQPCQHPTAHAPPMEAAVLSLLLLAIPEAGLAHEGKP